jgi:hypothetical protein
VRAQGLFRKILVGEFKFPAREWDHTSKLARKCVVSCAAFNLFDARSDVDACHARFIRFVLVKDPALRPSASACLRHEWLGRVYCERVCADDVICGDDWCDGAMACDDVVITQLPPSCPCRRVAATASRTCRAIRFVACALVRVRVHVVCDHVRAVCSQDGKKKEPHPLPSSATRRRDAGRSDTSTGHDDDNDDDNTHTRTVVAPMTASSAMSSTSSATPNAASAAASPAVALPSVPAVSEMAASASAKRRSPLRTPGASTTTTTSSADKAKDERRSSKSGARCEMMFVFANVRTHATNTPRRQQQSRQQSCYALSISRRRRARRPAAAAD